METTTRWLKDHSKNAERKKENQVDKNCRANVEMCRGKNFDSQSRPDNFGRRNNSEQDTVQLVRVLDEGHVRHHGVDGSLLVLEHYRKSMRDRYT